MGKPKLDIEWKQEGNKIYFDYEGTEIYFLMPSDFKLSETHPDLLKLAEWLMFSPWYDVLEGYEFSREPGENWGLVFSAGVDSTATLGVLPEDTKIIYTQRDGIDDRVLKQDNALRMILQMDEPVFRCRTNFELIRTFHGKMIGYSTAIGMGVPTVLLADYYNLGKISYGKVMDDQFFPKGVYRDYTKDFLDREELLKSSGLIPVYPFVGCAEVITCGVVENSKYADITFSCIRGQNGRQCNNCYKCFRKNLLRGKSAYYNSQSRYSISKNPPKMAPSLMYALNKHDIVLDEVREFKDMDLSILEKYNPEAYKILSDEDRKYVEEQLKILGIERMSPEEVEQLKKLNFVRASESLEPNLALP